MINYKTPKELARLAHQFRLDIINILYKSQSGHPGGSLSSCEILTTLYYNIMNIDPKNPKMEDRDRLVLSKGHCAPAAYAIMAELGFFSKEELNFLRKAGNMLQGHPHRRKIPGADYTAGSLGLGLSFATGVALNARLDKKGYYIYTLLGDGELQEGCVWEAFHTLVKYNLNNIITIVDNNGVQLDGTNSEIMPGGSLQAKIKAFGCNVIDVNGHDCTEIENAIKIAQNEKNKPTVIFAETVKGKGVSFMEGNAYWHGANIDEINYKLAIEELEGKFIG